MPINQLHHLNYLVKDLNESTRYFSAILQQEPVVERLLKREVITARYDLSGTYFILVQPTSEQGVVAQTLAEKGEGLFLLSLAVDELQTAIDDLKTREISADLSSRRQGLDGWDICDLQSISDSRTTIQLCATNSKS